MKTIEKRHFEKIMAVTYHLKHKQNGECDYEKSRASVTVKDAEGNIYYSHSHYGVNEAKALQQIFEATGIYKTA